MASAVLWCRPSLATVISTARRLFHSSSVVAARKDDRDTARAGEVQFNLMDLEPPEREDDTTVAGHLMLRQHRQRLYHMRLIEHEMPKLVGELHRTHTFERI
jgi:hypothetical protein